MGAGVSAATVLDEIKFAFRGFKQVATGFPGVLFAVLVDGTVVAAEVKVDFTNLTTYMSKQIVWLAAEFVAPHVGLTVGGWNSATTRRFRIITEFVAGGAMEPDDYDPQ